LITYTIAVTIAHVRHWLAIFRRYRAYAASDGPAAAVRLALEDREDARWTRRARAARKAMDE